MLAIRRPVDGVDADGLRDMIELMVERIEALAPVAAGQRRRRPKASVPHRVHSV